MRRLGHPHINEWVPYSWSTERWWWGLLAAYIHVYVALQSGIEHRNTLQYIGTLFLARCLPPTRSAAGSFSGYIYTPKLVPSSSCQKMLRGYWKDTERILGRNARSLRRLISVRHVNVERARKTLADTGETPAFSCHTGLGIWFRLCFKPSSNLSR